jgi:hypothetical protein
MSFSLSLSTLCANSAENCGFMQKNSKQSPSKIPFMQFLKKCLREKFETSHRLSNCGL